MRRTDFSGADCAMAQALDVVGDWWTLLIVRDVTRGRSRFDTLQAGLGVSRKVLAERLRWLVDHEVLQRELYHEHPPRYDYRLTTRGRALLPVLVALQDWGDTWLLGDGALSATTTPGSAECHRVHALSGVRLPELLLPAADGPARDPVADTDFTVLTLFPGAGLGIPGWAEIPGAPGCTASAAAYRALHAEFRALGASVHGVSTQRPDELARFADAEDLPFPLLSDAGLDLVTALRLPTFRAGGADRHKRLSLLVDRDRVVRSVFYPISDPACSAEQVLSGLTRLYPRPGAALPQP
ncbi:DNA-binding HxlR family transcriptional regulator/peroxiredoxin [Crossiella equi]|uniref:DNA-binding HxlR family transcriptional regulator/peroxiredoxin n=1 Tax=Crossiella equi TaxID=130796 RepID=A0ABS5A3Y2_9PSEU|nr:winged helix-turn-helix transcriptional regulator [Crossiella equi]MBP2471286.1 DNA-binding HxlR family transcriptional regulator/peroxiredoxin [Crossiella equi]